MVYITPKHNLTFLFSLFYFSRNWKMTSQFRLWPAINRRSSGRSSALRCTALLYPNVTSVGGVFKSTQKQRIFQYLKRYLKRSHSLEKSNYLLSFQVVRDLMFLCAIHCLPIIFQQCRFLLHIATCN